MEKKRIKPIRPQIDRKDSPRPKIEITPVRDDKPSPRPNMSLPQSLSQSLPQPSPKTQISKRKASPKKQATIAHVKQYSDQDIHEILSDGYILIIPQLWDHIPPGAHIRYIKKGETPRSERFRPGGFVKSHFVADNAKMLMLETRICGKKDDAGYTTFPVAYADIDELWKKYDRGAFIEIHLINNSLAQKKQYIDDLTTKLADQKKQIDELTARINTLEGILKRAIGR